MAAQESDRTVVFCEDEWIPQTRTERILSGCKKSLQGKFICIAPFLHKAIHGALQRPWIYWNLKQNQFKNKQIIEIKTIVLWNPDMKNEISHRALASCDTGQRGVAGTNHAGQPNFAAGSFQFHYFEN